MKRSGSVLLFLLLLCVRPVFAGTLSDTDKEQRWAEQVIETLFDGETVWLTAAGHEFLGIEMQATGRVSNQAVILVHGIGVHPNWDQIIRPLRVGLAESGWHTLSIQMPILANDVEITAYRPLYDEVSGRFNAAVTHLQDQEVSHIIIIGHSTGASMASHYMALHPDSPVEALVLIGMNSSAVGTSIDTAPNIRAINVPVLDLYGSEDLPGVIDSAPRRLEAAHAGENSTYRQVRVDGANHFFDGRDQELVDEVNRWLENLTVN